MGATAPIRSAAAPASPEPLLNTAPDMPVTLTFREQEHALSSEPGERLLYACLRHGIDLPYECATGTCGSCKADLVSGEVEDLWADAPGRKYLRGARELLLCQSAARGDCRIEVRSRNPSPAPRATPAFGRGTVSDARTLAPDVLAFSVDLDRPLDFEAGQFVCLQFPHVSGYRSYSIVNFESRCRRLDFVVRRKADGRLTPWLFANSIEGSQVEWFGPLGRATFQPGAPRDLLCIAGGTGIAGMLSILRCATASGHFAQRKASVFFGVRTPRDAFYLQELDALAAAAQGALAVTVAFSDEGPDADFAAGYPHLRFSTGLVHAVAQSSMKGDYRGVVAYLAGPKPAVDASMRMLLAARVAVQDMRFDRFS